MKKPFSIGLTGRVLVPVTIIMLVSAIALAMLLRRSTTDATFDQCVRQAIAVASQFKTLRACYTDKVVRKIKAGTDLKVTYDHQQNEKAVPLPATMIHDLSTELSRQTNGIRLRLYSSHPFPNRKDRAVDAFMRDALDHFAAHTNGTFVRGETLEGQRFVRVAVPDHMSAAACVQCHNSHPESPKRDWQLGDVRGVLEVDMPAEAALAANDALLVRIGGTTMAGSRRLAC